MPIILLLILLQNDSFWNNAPAIIGALGLFITVLVGALIKLLTFLRSIRKEVATVAKFSIATDKKIDGLLDQKTLADKALGALQAIEEAAKIKAIGDARELQTIKEQQLKDQPPASQPNRDSDIKETKDEIVRTLKTEIKKEGEKIQEEVKIEGGNIKEEVVKVPDEVVKRLPPK